jgi:streptomycin 6-kinase
VVQVEDIRARLTRRFGPAVAGWCAELPTLVDTVARQWGLRPGPAWPLGGTSVVLPCQTGNGEQMMLKLTPDLKIAADEATALDLWSASPHVVQLHDADPGRGALLLERVSPGTRLQDEPDRWPLADVAPMLTDLWRPAWISARSGLPNLRDRVKFTFDLTRVRLARHPAAARHIPPGLVEASEIAAGALVKDGPVGLVHGDLHPGNVLRGGSGRGVVAIDPRPCLGDRAFDAVDWVLASGGSKAAMQQRVDWLALHVDGLGAERAWAWSQALAVVVAVSLLAHREDDPAGHALLQLASAGR